MRTLNLISYFTCIIWFSSVIAGFSQIDDIQVIRPCSFKNTGEISFTLDSTYLTGYPLPYIVEWENLTTGDFSDNETLSGFVYNSAELFAGEYEFSIWLDKECKIKFDTVLTAWESDSIRLNPRIIEPECGYNNGSISLQATGGVPPYIYTWEKHYDVPTIENLTEGYYCVTVTDQECGYSEFCAELNFIYPSVQIKDINQISDCNPTGGLSCDGSIEVEVSNVEFYLIYWIDMAGDTLDEGAKLSNICNIGTYLASISFSEKCQPLIYEFYVGCCNDLMSDLEIDIEPTPGCGDPNALDAIVSGGEEPYIYQWSNFASTSHVDNLENKEYFVTVTDSLGCSIVDSFDFNFVQEVSRTVPCEDLFDGDITFLITNSNNCPVTITYDYTICDDCGYLPIIQEDTSSEIELTLTQLGGNINYTFFIYMCGCEIPFQFKLPEEEWTETFVGVDDIGDWTFKCYYDIDCKMNHADSGRVELAEVDLNPEDIDCEGLFSKDCGKIEYECGGEVVKEKDVKAKVMRRERAVQLAKTLGYDPALVDATTGADNPCDWVSVCPNDPTCVHGAAHGQFGGTFQYYEYLGNDCWRVKCKIGFVSSSYKVCGLDYVPNYLVNYFDTSFSFNLNLNGENCNPVERNVGQLTMFLSEMENVPGFKGRELYNFLKAHATDPKRFCARVRFCTSDFSIIWHSNFEDIICEALDPPLIVAGFSKAIEQTCFPYEDGKGDLRAFCHNLCSSSKPGDICPPQPVLLERVYNPNWIAFTGEEISTQFLARYNSPTKFVRFSPAKQNDSTTTVNTIFKSNDDLLYHPYSDAKWFPYESDEMEYLFQHFDSSYIMGIVKDTSANNSYDFLASNEDTLIVHTLVSSNTIELNKLWTNSSNHITTGMFSGILSFDGQTIASSLSNAFFITQMNNDLQRTTLHKINQNGWKICIDDQSGDLAFSSHTTNSLTINNTLQSGIGTREIVTMDGLNSTVSIRDQNLVISNAMKLLEYKRGLFSANYVIAGTGNIMLNGNQIFTTSTSSVILLNIQNNGTVNWIKSFGVAAVDTSIISIEMIEGDETYFSFNTIGNITLNDSLFVNAGGTDIIIFGLDTSGSYTNVYSYNSPSDEQINDLFYSNGLLYLGGEVDENTYSRQIGALHFENYSEDFGQAINSYIILSSDSLEVDGFQDEIILGRNSSNNSDILISPNPTNGIIKVKLTHPCEKMNITIRDFTGRDFKNVYLINPDISEGIEINLGSIPPGLYIVTVESECYFSVSEPFLFSKP